MGSPKSQKIQQERSIEWPSSQSSYQDTMIVAHQQQQRKERQQSSPEDMEPSTPITLYDNRSPLAVSGELRRHHTPSAQVTPSVPAHHNVHVLWNALSEASVQSVLRRWSPSSLYPRSREPSKQPAYFVFASFSRSAQQLWRLPLQHVQGTYYTQLNPNRS